MLKKAKANVTSAPTVSAPSSAATGAAAPKKSRRPSATMAVVKIVARTIPPSSAWCSWAALATSPVIPIRTAGPPSRRASAAARSAASTTATLRETSSAGKRVRATTSCSRPSPERIGAGCSGPRPRGVHLPLERAQALADRRRSACRPRRRPATRRAGSAAPSAPPARRARRRARRSAPADSGAPRRTDRGRRCRSRRRGAGSGGSARRRSRTSSAAARRRAGVVRFDRHDDRPEHLRPRLQRVEVAHRLGRGWQQVRQVAVKRQVGGDRRRDRPHHQRARQDRPAPPRGPARPAQPRSPPPSARMGDPHAGRARRGCWRSPGP